MLGRKLLMAGEPSVTDFFNGFDTLSTFSGGPTQVLDYQGNLITVPVGTRAIEGGNLLGGVWLPTGLTPSYMVPVKGRADVAKYGQSFKGYLNEPVRTNIYFPSAAPVTKTVTTTAQVYTVSVIGSGSVTLTGTASGTATAASPLTVTATAGTLTVTVSGALTHCQIEAGAFKTSPIVTTTAAVSRPASNLTRPTAGVLPVNDFGIWGRVDPLATAAVQGGNFMLFSSGTAFYISATAIGGLFLQTSAGIAVSIGTLNTSAPFEWQLQKKSTSGLQGRVYQAGAWTAWITINSSLVNADVQSTYSIGCRNGIAQFAANYPFLAIISHSDPKVELERLSALYPT